MITRVSNNISLYNPVSIYVVIVISLDIDTLQQILQWLYIQIAIAIYCYRKVWMLILQYPFRFQFQIMLLLQCRLELYQIIYAGGLETVMA